MRVVGSPFHIDWTDQDAVIAYAERLGPGHTVYKRPDRDNYNICHTSNYVLDKGMIVFRTENT